jgi:hypothetical protein
MSRPVPTALLGTFDAQIYRCACGAWCIGCQPCETCIRLAIDMLAHRRHAAA